MVGSKQLKQVQAPLSSSWLSYEMEKLNAGVIILSEAFASPITLTIGNNIKS